MNESPSATAMMTMPHVFEPLPSVKFLVQCLSEQGDLLVFTVDLSRQQTQLIFKQPIQATIMDHQIHAGSHEYSLVLTDEGHIHFYHIM
jgi:hypothetical protein